MIDEVYNQAFQRIMKLAPYQGRRFVPGEGPSNASLMLVGEAPGETEDLLRRPFVGKGGALLDECLSEVGIPRSSTYITNVFKLRPPHNRPPTEQEIEDFSPLLHSEIRIVSPDVIVALGSTASRWFYPGYVEMVTARLKTYHRSFNGKVIRVILTYHPAFILRHTAFRPFLVEDLTKASIILSERRVGRLKGNL